MENVHVNHWATFFTGVYGGELVDTNRWCGVTGSQCAHTFVQPAAQYSYLAWFLSAVVFVLGCLYSQSEVSDVSELNGPLHWACRYNIPDIVELLVDHGASLFLEGEV